MLSYQPNSISRPSETVAKILSLRAEDATEGQNEDTTRDVFGSKATSAQAAAISDAKIPNAHRKGVACQLSSPCKAKAMLLKLSVLKSGAEVVEQVSIDDSNLW